MPSISLWFPTAIYTEENILSKKELECLFKRSEEIKNTIPSGGKDWRCKIYTTFGTNYNLLDDPIFKLLIEKVTQHVNSFAKEFGSIYQYKAFEGFLNIYDSSCYQEYHYHTSSTFSVVYYLKVPKGSGHFIFNDPKGPDMLEVKDMVKETTLNQVSKSIEPIENSLIMFRSYLGHSVSQGINNDDRISIAFNF